jgi:hypothetical protein
MLPMTLQFLILMIASAINDRLQRRLDYVEDQGNSWRTTMPSVSIRGLVGS